MRTKMCFMVLEFRNNLALEKSWKYVKGVRTSNVASNLPRIVSSMWKILLRRSVSGEKEGFLMRHAWRYVFGE